MPDDPTLAALAAPFREFVSRLAPGKPVAVLCHSDADGLAAGAILAKALERTGHAVAVEVTGKGEGAWSPAVRDRVAAHRPQAVVVADLGCRADPVLDGVPTLFVDHHRPTGVPPGAVLVTGYGADPTPTSGVLAWECGKLVADVADLDWVAAVSVLSDVGDGAPFEVLAEAKKRHKATPLKDATSLLNAPRRAAAGDARPALALLLKAAGPKDVTAGKFPETDRLKAAKAEVSAAFAEAKKAAPAFARPTNVALIRMHSPCQVHPMVAQIWRTRLPKQIVLAANTGYLPGRVNFSMRTGAGANLLDFLRDHAPPGAGPDYGNGHDQATGGSLAYDVWDRFVTGLGFGPEAVWRREAEPGAEGHGDVAPGSASRLHGAGTEAAR